MTSPRTLKIALDWTPNTLHTGLYLAAAKGIYARHNLDVQLLPPDSEYSLTPAKQLERGDVVLAICPSESCIAYHESGKLNLQAVYAICQKDASAIVSTKLQRIADLGKGGKYGSYNARYEDALVREMVKKDGGDADGMKIERQEGKLSLFDSLRRGRVDATWVFIPWEGIEEAESDGTGLHAFRLEDYGIPYGYSPVIAHAAGKLDPETLKTFVTATAEGYKLAMNDVDAAVNEMSKHCNPPRSEQFLRKSQEAINQYYSDGSSQLGRMSEEKWHTWLDWLRENGMLGDGKITAESLFTNP